MRLAGALSVLWGLAQPATAADLRDDRGIPHRGTPPAQRIVALSPHLTELAFAAGAGARLVGVVRFSDFPMAARELPLVGDSARVDAERLLELKPDLVLGWLSGNPPSEIRKLENLGLPVFVTEPARLADISRVIRMIGLLAGTEHVAERVATEFSAGISALRQRYASDKPVRVFYEIWHRPLLTVNQTHYISDVIALCGGVNVFGALPVLTPAVSVEAVLAAAPQVVVGGGSAADAHEFTNQWRSYPLVSVRALRLLHLPPDDIQRPTPRILSGAGALCRYLEQVRRRQR